MNFWSLVGRSIGLEKAEQIKSVHCSLAADWAQSWPGLLMLVGGATLALSLLFYARTGSRAGGARWLLALCRAAVLVLALLLLTDPTLTVRYAHRPLPQVWVLFDGSESMQIQDALPEESRRPLAEAVGLPASTATPSRLDYVRSWASRPDQNVLTELAGKARVRAFLMDRPDSVRELAADGTAEAALSPAAVAEQLEASAQVSALGSALHDLARRRTGSPLGGVVVISDFANNSGLPPVAAAKELGVPVHTVGVGATMAIDLSLTVQSSLVMKKDERSSVSVLVRQQGLEGQAVTVELFAQPVGDLTATPGDGSALDAAVADVGGTLIGRQTVTLATQTTPVDFFWVPKEAGPVNLVARTTPLPEEASTSNNTASRRVTIRDDYLRLLFVEYEPTWEWRFIKEVFHRDPLVGERGFRTYLQSADPKVRQSNELFLPTLLQPRHDFFTHDVVVLGDMPADALPQNFAEMLREFVSRFGGGLVVTAGPRFGPGQLERSPIADMLPVVVDRSARRKDQPFVLQRTEAGRFEDFMQLGGNASENEKAWDNLGKLPWYQPVARPHPLATVLAEHPSDRCLDGRTPQPLIAVRRFGRGEVVYLGNNETWRLRRRFGELYYRQFWGHLIYRLGLSHTLGEQKRFVVLTDSRQYRVGDEATVTVEAYDREFRPLDAATLPGKVLAGQLVPPGGRIDTLTNVDELAVPMLTAGRFETRVRLLQAGEHRLRVRDPLAEGDEQAYAEATVVVANISIEQQQAEQNTALARQLAEETGGRSFDLTNAHELARLDYPTREEITLESFPLASTWLYFCLLIGLMLLEWTVRKWLNLP